jgi:cobalt-zinc-cadmium efflux system membrane fusion protein
MTPRFPSTCSQMLSGLLACSLALMLSACTDSKKPEAALSEKPMGNTVQLDPEAWQAAHLVLLTAQARTVDSPLMSTGTIKANENRMFHINSFVSGRVQQDRVGLGDAVRSGQILAVVQNLEVAKIQANYIHELHNNEIDISQAKTRRWLAKSRMERERRLWEEGVSPQKDYQQAQADAELANTELEGKLEHRTHLKSEAKALLSAYGLSLNSAHSERINTLSPIMAPRSGVVVKKNITLGDMVTPDTVMYEVTDLSQLWLDVAVFPKDIALLHVGQRLVFTSDSLPGKQFVGKIDYIQPNVQENSQTYIARAYLSQAGGLLKPGIFGQVRLERNLARSQVVVPESAVQRYGRETFVFVPEGNYRFRKQTVVLGHKVQDGYGIEQGLSAGTQVVGQGSFALKAELLKSLSAQEE